MHIAIVEDDEEIGPLMLDLLRREGFEGSLCRDAGEFDQLIARQPIDLAILDLMLPGEDGLSLCRRIRARSSMGVLMVTAKGDDVDRIVGLELGADDYLPKPFNPRELIARVRAILRRVSSEGVSEQGERYRFGSWTIDVEARALRDAAGDEQPVTAGEFDLLLCFVRHPGRVLSRDQLLDWTRGRMTQPFDRTIDNQVSRLRRRLADHPMGEQLIRTVRGGGYQFADRVERF